MHYLPANYSAAWQHFSAFGHSAFLQQLSAFSHGVAHSALAAQLSALQHFFSTHSVFGQHSLAHSPLSAFLQQQLIAQNATAAINKIFFILLSNLMFIFSLVLPSSAKPPQKYYFFFEYARKTHKTKLINLKFTLLSHLFSTQRTMSINNSKQLDKENIPPLFVYMLFFL